MKNQIVHLVTDYYLGSPDFNGLVGSKLSSLEQDSRKLNEAVYELVSEGYLALLHDEFTVNKHIFLTSFPTIEMQLGWISAGLLREVCLYPTPLVLNHKVDHQAYSEEPFRLYLALGHPQLGAILCYPYVLERYRSDPRYIYQTDDICGHLVVSDDFFETGNIPECDEIMLKRFGFAVSEKGGRAAAAMLRDLAGMSSQHQKIWASHIIDGDEIARDGYQLIEDYRRHLRGEPRECCSLTTAFMYEINAINEIAKICFDKKLFINDWSDGFDRLNDLTMMLRPTRKELDGFIHLLDKTLSDNLNKKFFEGIVPLEREVTISPGKVRIESKGTLALLREWLEKDFSSEKNSIDCCMRALNRVRKERQKPAHVIQPNTYSLQLWLEQHNLLLEVHGGLKALRTLFEIHFGDPLSVETKRRLALPISPH